MSDLASSVSTPIYDTTVSGQCRNSRLAKLILIVIPIVMAVINQDWLFTPIGYLDSWYNVAYFLRYSNEDFLNQYYKISRLGWIIPGYVTYAIFNPLVANYVLHIGALTLSALALFSALRRIFSTKVGFVASALLIVHVPFHGSGGWDYQTTPAGAYYLISYALLTHAAYQPARLWLLCAAGMSAAAAVHANVLVINLLPVLAVHFFALTRLRRQEPLTVYSILSTGLATLAGAVVLTLALASINKLVGRDFNFMRVMFDFVSSFVADPSQQKSWWLPWSTSWLLNAAYLDYLGVPIAVLAACVVALILASVRRWPVDPMAVAMIAQYMLAVAIWCIWQTMGHTALQPRYFAHPLIPVMFCAVGGLIALRAHDSDQSDTPVFYLVIALTAVTTLSFNVGAYYWRNIDSYSLVIVGGAFLGAFIMSVSRRNWFILALAALLISVSNNHAAVVGQAQGLYSYKQTCSVRRKHFEGLIAADQFLNSYTQNSSNIRIWWDRSEILKDDKGCLIELANFASSMAAFGSLYLAPPWGGMPSIENLPETSLKQLTATSLIAIPTNNPALIDQLVARFAREGIALQVVGKRLIRTRPASFELWVLAVQSG